MRLGRSAGVTNTGRKRRRNEDSFVREPPIFAVADGMGGAQAGEIASRLAASAVEDEERSELGGEERVASLIQEANRRVYERSSEPDKSGMGTTMTVALVEDGRVAIGHVGDSRAYLVRDGRLEQLTEDHSLVSELVRSGKLSPEEAETHPQRSVITRALGTDPDVDVDTFTIQGRAGDLFLLCSDGLSSMVHDEEILRTLERAHEDLEAAATALVDAANRGGGEDNITVVCFEITDAPTASQLEETARYPAVADTEIRVEDEAETLSGLEAVPAVGTMVIPRERIDDWMDEDGAGPEPEPQPERRRPGRGRRVFLALVALSVLAALCALLLLGFSRAHFVGAEDDGHVAVYQGVPWDLTGSVHLYRAVYVSNLLAAQLTRDERRSLFDHHLRSYDGARGALRTYERRVAP